MDVLLALMNVLLVTTLFSPIRCSETANEVAESSPRRVVFQNSFSRFSPFKQIPHRDIFDPEAQHNQLWDSDLQTIDPHIGSLMRSNIKVVNSVRRLEIKFDRLLDRLDSEESFVHEVMAKLNQIHQHNRDASKSAFRMDCTTENEMPQNELLRELEAAVRYSNENIKKLVTNVDMVIESGRISTQSLEKVLETVLEINDRTIRIHHASSGLSPAGTSYLNPEDIRESLGPIAVITKVNERPRNAYSTDSDTFDRNPSLSATNPSYAPYGNGVIHWNRNLLTNGDSNKNRRLPTNYGLNGNGSQSNTVSSDPNYKSRELENRNSFTADERQESQTLGHNGQIEREKDYKGSGVFNPPTTSSNYESSENEVYKWNRNSHRTNGNKAIDDENKRKEPITRQENYDLEMQTLGRNEALKNSNFESGEAVQNRNGGSSTTLNKEQEKNDFSYSRQDEIETEIENGSNEKEKGSNEKDNEKENGSNEKGNSSNEKENGSNEKEGGNIVGSTKTSQEESESEVDSRELSYNADTSSTYGPNRLPSTTGTTNNEGNDSNTRKTTTTKVRTSANTQKTYRSVRKDMKRVTFEPDKQNCHDLRIKKNGIYKFDSIYEMGNNADRFFYERYCDFYTDDDGGAWTVIQRRFANDNQESFNRTWTDYKLGFGKLDGEFWFGNDFIHKLTYDDDVELRIILEDEDGKTDWLQYSTFRVESEADNYKLVIGGYSGSVADSFLYHNDQDFSTYDRRNGSHDCAETIGNGWWFRNCTEGILENWLGSTSTRMMIRPKYGK